MIISSDREFKKIECGGCGIEFFVPKKFYEDLKETKKGFTCPNGCNRKFTKSKSEELQEKLDEEQQIIREKMREIDEKDSYITSLERKVRRFRSPKKQKAKK